MDITPRSSMNDANTSNDKTKQPEQAAAPPPAQQQPQSTPSSSAAPESATPTEPKPFAMDNNPQQQGQAEAASPATPATTSPSQPAAAAAQPASSTNFNVEEAVKTEAAPSAVPQADTAAQSTNPESPQAAAHTTPPSPPAPAATPTPQSPAAASPATAPGGKPAGKKRLSLPWVVGIITALIVLAGAFVFGYYLPNQPDNVYRTGLDRSGDVIKELTTELTQSEKLETFRQSAITADVSFTSSGMQASGVLNSRFDDARSDSTLDVSYGPDEDTQQELGVQVMTDSAEGAQFPDVFMNFSGIGQLGLEAYLPTIGDYDGQWIHIPSTLIEESLAGVEVEVNPSELEMTAEDYAELVSAVTDVTNEYVFTSNSDTAIFENQEYVAAEDINGVSTYKYTVDINRDNLLAYCQNIQEHTLRTEAYRKLSGQDEAAIDSEIERGDEQCEATVDSFLGEIELVELWVDRSYKLVHQIRFHASEEAGYVDIGQIYSGGDSVTFFVGTQVEENEETMQMRLEATTDLDSLSTTAEMTGARSGDNGFELVATLQAEPVEGDIEFERPSDAIDFETFLDELFGGAFTTPEPQPVQSENFQGEVEFQQPLQLSDDAFGELLNDIL